MLDWDKIHGVMLVILDIHFFINAGEAIGQHELFFLEKCVVLIDAALAAFAHEPAPE
jgi:hypothetical protein